MQYKCVPAPLGLVITGKKDYESAVRSFADIINREAIDGWKYHSMEYISVKHQPGCLPALFGAKPITESYNMLIFSNEKVSKKTEMVSEENSSNAPSVNANYGDEYIVISKTFIRTAPDYNGDKKQELAVDDKVIIQSVSDDYIGWACVKLSDGTEGWCMTACLKKC